ncbi:MAG TPA: toll/interleukin-1 receptor domain-containing protein, partial [Allocoleopsis sp.]
MVNAPIASVPAPDTDVRENDVFISYDSNDLAFVEQLKEAIRSQKLQIWEIGKNLPIGVSPNSKDAWQYIEAGIQNSHIFVFVISPKSIVSNQSELEIAIQCKKDLVLISYQAIENERLPEAIRDADQTIVDLSSSNPFEPVAQKIERI